MKKLSELLELYSRWITLAVFFMGLFVFLVLPVMALSWSNRPFPGFLVEPTLLVNDIKGTNWTGKQAGIGLLERITRISGVEIQYQGMYDEILYQKQIGDSVTFFTEMENGSNRLYPSVRLMEFPPGDFLRLFWVPYLIGLVYYIIGVWVYLVRGKYTRPGRALAFFCVNTALATAVIFDIYTTHRLTIVWMGALAFTGGALISLGMRFPQEWGLVSRHPWLLAIPYIPSAVLVAWGVRVIFFPASPWSYIQNWAIIYRYTGFGIIFFLILILFQAFTNKLELVRRQSRIVLLGSFLAFLPITYFFIAPLLKISVSFNSLLFLPPLVFFPISVTLAITRYRLLEMDAIVNRAVVYSTLTAAIGGLFTSLVLLMRYIFAITSGEKNDIALIITTFVVASLFNPIKDRIQKFVDRQFKHSAADMPQLKIFAEQVRGHLKFSQAEEVSRQFLYETARSLGAKSARLVIYRGDQPQFIHSFGIWEGKIVSSIPLVYMGGRVGLLLLGPRINHRAYTQSEVALVHQVSRDIAQVIHTSSLLLSPVQPERVPDLEPG